MKKWIAMILFSALALSLLTACEPMASSSSEETVSPGKDTPAEFNPLHDSDPNFVHGNYDRVCATEDTVYFAYEVATKVGERVHAVINFFDKTSGYAGPLCGKPECTHNDSTCNAYIEGSVYGLSIYDGRLYWMVRPYTYASPGLYSAALDGTDRRLVRELERDELPNGPIQGTFHRGWFYLIGDYNEVVDGEANKCVYAAAWPLNADDEGVVILDVATGAFTPFYAMRAYGDGVYLMVESGTYNTLQMSRWDASTGELKTFYDGERPFGLFNSFSVEVGGLMFYSMAVNQEAAEGEDPLVRALYRYDFQTGAFEQRIPDTLYARHGLTAYGGQVVGDVLVMMECVGENELAVLVQDIQSNILLDQTCLIEGGLFTDLGAVVYCGRDETNLYIYSMGFTRADSLIAVALDGSGATVLWDDETGVH